MLNQIYPVDEFHVDEFPTLLKLHELDAEPTISETRAAFKYLNNKVSSSSDGIPGEIYKYRGNTITLHLHEILCICWKNDLIPQC